MNWTIWVARSLLSALFVTGTSAQAGGIRLIETKDMEDANGAYVLRHVSTQAADMDDNFPSGSDVWIRHPAGKHGDKPFLINQAGSIAAFNISPATKWEMVYLLLSFNGSDLILISDFNTRIAKLCAAHKKGINEREIEIDEIKNDVITLWSRDDDHTHYDLSIRVLPSGEFRLLQHEKSKP